MKFSNNQLLLFKAIDNHTLAHIFEHIIGHRFFREMARKNLFLISDFRISYLKTIDEICIFGIITQNPKTQKIIAKTIEKISAEKITINEMKKAAREISLENMQKIVVFDQKIIAEIQKIQNQSWIGFENFGNAGFRNKLNSEFLQFGKKNRKFFETFAIEIIAPRKFTGENQSRRAVALFAVQTLTLNMIQNLETPTNFYDIGAQWAYDFREIIYRTNWRFFKNEMSEERLQENLRKYLNDFGEIFAKNLSKTLREKFAKNEFYIPIDLEKIANILGDGGLIGGKIWREFGSEENLREIFSGIKFKIYRRENIDIISQD